MVLSTMSYNPYLPVVRWFSIAKCVCNDKQEFFIFNIHHIILLHTNNLQKYKEIICFYLRHDGKGMVNYDVIAQTAGMSKTRGD